MATPAAIITFNHSSASESAVICKFPHGLPADINSLGFQYYSSRDDRKANNRFLLAQSPNADYIGKNYGENDSNKFNNYKYAVGIVNVNTSSSVELVEIPHIYSMQPKIKTLRQSSESNKDENKQSYAELQSNLVEQFGSKKRKSQLKSKAANKITLQEDISYVLHSALQSNNPNNVNDNNQQYLTELVIEDEDDTIIQTKSLVLPSFNLNTEDVDEIYPRSSIITPMEQDLLNGRHYVKLSKDPVELGIFFGKQAASNAYISEYVVSRIKSLNNIHNTEHAKQRGNLIDYLRCLLQFRSFDNKNKARQLKFLYSADPIKDKLLALFTTKQEQHYPCDSQGQIKLLAYICVTALLVAEEYRIVEEELNMLARDLKYEVTKLVAVFREVGCTIASKTRVQLTAPLTLPKLTRKKRKTKK
jgi:hypothetical protein